MNVKQSLFSLWLAVLLLSALMLPALAQTPPTQASTMQQWRGNEAHTPTLLDGQLFLASPSSGPLHHWARLYVGGADGSGTAGNQLLWDFSQTVVNSVNSLTGSVSLISSTPGLVVTSSGATISLGFGAASGDISGTYPALTVTGLQGLPVAVTAPSSGQVLAWSGSQWTPTTPATGSAYPVVSVAFSGGSSASQTILPTVSSSVAGTILRVSSDGVPTGHTYTLELPNTTPLSDGYVLRIERSSETSSINVYTYAAIAGGGSGDSTTGIVGPNNQFVAGASPPGSLPVGLTNGNATLTLTLDKSNHVWHVTNAQDGSTAISEVQVGGSPILASRAVNIIAGSGVTLSQTQTSYSSTSGTGSGGKVTNITIAASGGASGGASSNQVIYPTSDTITANFVPFATQPVIAASDISAGGQYRYSFTLVNGPGSPLISIRLYTPGGTLLGSVTGAYSGPTPMHFDGDLYFTAAGTSGVAHWDGEFHSDGSSSPSFYRLSSRSAGWSPVSGDFSGGVKIVVLGTNGVTATATSTLVQFTLEKVK